LTFTKAAAASDRRELTYIEWMRELIRDDVEPVDNENLSYYNDFVWEGQKGTLTARTNNIRLTTDPGGISRQKENNYE